ncbi:hypothetical protein BBJ28_00023541 [Nothophytophthora sp. Chile5]|nr:hypothetical protein BBJ28_00023541 [Nothophytophthora sp. Chile5]
MAGDVASAFRNIGIHSNSVYLFAGHIEEDDVIVIELVAPFGWTGSPGFYEIAGGAIAHVHGAHANDVSPTGFFNYHWVDDHINVAADIGANCDDMDRSLRFAIVAVLGADAINTKKFTNWSTRQRVLGLVFDSVEEQVSMPAEKIKKAWHIVAAAYSASTLPRKAYRSLMGSLRHVATCIRAARPFLQRLRQRESRLHRFQSVRNTYDMRNDLLWWWLVLHTPQLNGVSLDYFNTLPPPDVVVETDASDYGLCTLDIASRQALTYQFSTFERSQIAEFKEGVPNGFDINFQGQPTMCPSTAHSVCIRLVGSKTNQGGAPTSRMLSRSGHPFLCPVFGALILLQARQNLPVNVPAAVYTNRCGRPACIATADVAEAIMRAATKIGSDPRQFSSHSLRAGGATHMYLSGTDALTIQFHGRWVSDAFKTYTRLCKESVATLSERMVAGYRGDSTLHQWELIA